MLSAHAYTAETEGRPDELTLRFERERETKNTIRYENAKDSECVVGALYSAKPSWPGWATPAS